MKIIQIQKGTYGLYVLTDEGDVYMQEYRGLWEKVVGSNELITQYKETIRTRAEKQKSFTPKEGFCWCLGNCEGLCEGV